MKRIKFIVSLFFIFSFMLLSAVSAFAQTATVKADLLNVRSLASTSSDIVTRVKEGDELEILSSSDGWYMVKTPDGFEGYVKSDYITLNAQYFGRVTASALMVRSSTGTSSPIVTKLNNGDVVELLSYDGSWYKIKMQDGTSGFASAEYIQQDSSVTAFKAQTVQPPAETTYTFPTGFVSSALTRLHETTGEYSTVIALLTKGEELSLLAYDGAWYKVRRFDGMEGYVSVGFVALTRETSLSGMDFPIPGYVNATTLNFRSAPSTWSNITASITKGTEISLYSYSDEWYKAKLYDGREGYVSSSYISLNPVAYTTTAPPIINSNFTPKVPPTDATRALGAQIVATAHEYMGIPYRYATEGPDSFDCSGFTMYIMNLYGIKLPRPSRDQYYCGFSVDKSELIPGDLVFFSSKNTSGVAHVGIYIGDGNFIHASSGSAYSVTVSSLSADYYTRHYLGAKRVI